VSQSSDNKDKPRGEFDSPKINLSDDGPEPTRLFGDLQKDFHLTESLRPGAVGEATQSSEGESLTNPQPRRPTEDGDTEEQSRLYRRQTKAEDSYPDGPNTTRPSRSPIRSAKLGRNEASILPADLVQSSIQLGILGSKGTGKTYMFQSLVHRTSNGDHSGALAPFFRGGRNELHKSILHRDTGLPVAWERVNPKDVVGDLLDWKFQPFTAEDNERWFHLKVYYRAGFRRFQRHLDVSFLDASGEALLRGPIGKRAEVWKEAYVKPNVIIVCIPFWVVFPNYDSPALDEHERERMLKESNTVFEHYTDILDKFGRRGRVTPILALTMADDTRCDFPEVRSRWIRAYTQTEHHYVYQFRKPRIVARYLAHARHISEYLTDQLSTGGPAIDWILPALNHIGSTKPWIIPMTACDGAYLQSEIRAKAEGAKEMAESAARGRKKYPVPGHVELPLLLALCEDSNTLM
jgi:hypothetical protein